MKSVAASMTWEVIAHGRWRLLSSTLGSIALPALVLSALKRDGALNINDPTTLMMHTIFSFMSMMFCGAALMQSQGKMAKLFTYPLSTAELVAWRFLPAMAIITVQMALITAVLNALFDLNWPIWGPALFAPVGLIASEAALWLTEKSPVWLAVAIGTVGALLGIWFQSRYGRLGASPDHYWHYITASEVLTLLITAVASYWVGVQAVARLRCGEPPFSLGIVDRIVRYIDSFSTFGTAPTTAFSSHCRYEWQRKGWFVPAGVLVLVVGGVVGWFFTSRDPESLILMFLGIGSGLSLLGIFGGMAFGNTGVDDAHYEMKSFLATRPISDADLARAILRTAATSVLLSFGIWAVSFALACLGLVAAGSSETVAKVAGLSWFVYAAMLFGPLAITGIVASLGFVGRLGAILITLTLFCSCIVAFAMLNTYISAESRSLLRQFVFIGGALTVLAVTPLLFAAAKRKQFLSMSVVSASGAFWLVAVAALLIFWPAALPFTFTAILLSLASAALVVVPLAAAPLALSANRHR